MSAAFAGKKLLVVGGTRDIGFETASKALEHGGSVVLVGSREDKVAQAQQALATKGPVTAIAADSMTREGIQQV